MIVGGKYMNGETKLNVNETNLSIEEFRQYITKKGRPTLLLRNRTWQQIFRELQKAIVPYKDGHKKKMNFSAAKIILASTNYADDGTTDYARYCMFINQTLSDIRKGNSAFCYYYYQIVQLLYFHKNLRTEYNEVGHFWEVWLEEK